MTLPEGSPQSQTASGSYGRLRLRRRRQHHVADVPQRRQGNPHIRWYQSPFFSGRLVGKHDDVHLRRGRQPDFHALPERGRHHVQVQQRRPTHFQRGSVNVENPGEYRITRNSDGLIVKEIDGDLGSGTTNYAYNAQNELTSATATSATTEYAYDPAGDLTTSGSTSQVYNSASELTSSTGTAGTTDYTYDAVGDLVGTNAPSGSATSDLYDMADRLIAVGDWVQIPQVTAISPSTRPLAKSATVTITGSGFKGATGVHFGGIAATSFKVVSNTEMTAVSPAETAGIVDITVTGPAGTSGTGTYDEFAYLPVPVTRLSVPQLGILLVIQRSPSRVPASGARLPYFRKCGRYSVRGGLSHGDQRDHASRQCWSGQHLRHDAWREERKVDRGLLHIQCFRPRQ